MTAPAPHSVSQLGSGYQGGPSLREMPVFIIGLVPMNALFPALIGPVLEGAQPHTLPRGHKAHGAFFPFKIDPHVSLSHWDSATLRFAKVRNVHG